jgi:putative ABC transport system permease protein
MPGCGLGWLPDEKTLFKEPKQVAITESMAKTYFGTIDVLDKQIKIVHQKKGVTDNYFIKGVFKDFPGNSHFKADLICSMDESQDDWSYTYLLLAPNIEFQHVQDSIQANWDKRYAEQDFSPIADLQALTDIHMHSHKSRELEQNGNVQTLYLLICGVLIILIISLINFVNLNYVKNGKNQL